jgi:peptidoglycan/xylan/chitin deacetylase (PgdA/CDA1 family)
VLCSAAVDDLVNYVDWSDLATQIEFARDNDSVALVHSHSPGVTVSWRGLGELLARVDDAGLEYVTYPELVPGPARAAIALSFDDDYFHEWDAMRSILAAHGARVTFFVTRVHLAGPDELAILARLRADGHAIEPHGAMHLDARQFVCEHGIDRYMDEEVMPSIAALRALGYPASAYAFPYGNYQRDVDGALTKQVKRVRVSPFSCPH